MKRKVSVSQAIRDELLSDKNPDPVPPALREAARSALDGAVKSALAQPFTHEVETFSLLSITEAVAHLARIHAVALLRATGLGLAASSAEEHAGGQWRESLPELADKHSVLIYLAAVAWGMRIRILSPNEAKLMIFLAQTQLTVFKMEMPGPLQAGALRAAPAETKQLNLLTDKSGVL